MNIGKIRSLALRTSDWYESRGKELLAAKCMLIGSDYQMAQGLLVSLGMRPYRSNRELLNEFCLLETGQIATDDSLCLMVAWAYTGSGRTDHVRKWIARLEPFTKASER